MSTTIEAGAIALTNYIRSGNGWPTVASLDDFLPDDADNSRALAAAVLSSLKPGDELPGGLVVEQGWRPIAEAPRDGTIIIGAFFSIRWADSHRKNDIVRCWWQPEFEAFISSALVMRMAPGYTIDGASEKYHSPVIEPVTHFMPLPAPPKEGE